MQCFLLHISGVRDELYGVKFPRSYSVRFILLRFVQEAMLVPLLPRSLLELHHCITEAVSIVEKDKPIESLVSNNVLWRFT